MCEKITLAGVLEIHVEPEYVKVYTVYRNDKINHTRVLLNSNINFDRCMVWK